RVDGLRLRDDVQAAAGVALDVDVVERLQPRPPPGPGTAHAFGDGADLAAALHEQGDDPVGLAELLHAQHHAGVAVQSHGGSLRRGSSGTAPPRAVPLALPTNGTFVAQVPTSVPIVGWVADRAIDRHHGDWLG